MTWHNLQDLEVRGKGWRDTAHPYDRLPARAEGSVTETVWKLSQQSAGLWVDFRCNAGSLQARCRLRAEPAPEHHYIKYLDLYARDSYDAWRWAGVSRYGFMPSGQTPLVEGLSESWRQWRLYLPLTFAVDTLEIGSPDGAELQPAPTDPRPPVVVYGTSIVHGCGHLSRPGMVWTSILGRRLEWPVVNLGFSGSARCEPALGAILAELDPAVFVVDPLANMSLACVEQNAEPFLRHLVEAHPRTPLLLIEDRTHAGSWLRPDYRPGQQTKQAAFRRIAERLSGEGYPIHYLEGRDLIGSDDEATTDGSHPSDLGAMRYADAVAPVVKRLLGVRGGGLPG